MTLYEAGRTKGRAATRRASRLTGRQMKAVVFLAHRGTVTMGEFADGLEIGRAAASELVARLTEKDVVVRADDPDDRRVVTVKLAARGGGLRRRPARAVARPARGGLRPLPRHRPRHPRRVPAHPDQAAERKARPMSVPATSAEAPAARPTRSPWVILAVLCLGLFMILLDGTIVNIAIPHIQTAFDTSFSNIEWVMNAYILAFAVLLVTMGRFGDLWGRRKLFVGGMVLFTLGSLACGLAPSIYLLIAFRVVQGIGGAAMMPSTLSIIASVFPADKRGAAMGVWGGVSGLAIGPRPGARRHHHPVRHLAVRGRQLALDLPRQHPHRGHRRDPRPAPRAGEQEPHRGADPRPARRRAHLRVAVLPHLRAGRRAEVRLDLGAPSWRSSPAPSWPSPSSTGASTA